MDNEFNIKVFACTCKNTLKLLDYSTIINSISGYKNVEIEVLDILCNAEGLNIISDFLKKDRNRAVIAACTPQKFEIVLQEHLRKNEINPYNFDIANIREHVAWVSTNKEKATKKAIALIKASINKILNSEKVPQKKIKIEPVICIIGGGIAGLQVAIDLHSVGLKPLIIEKENELGGHVNFISNVFPLKVSGKKIISDLILKIKEENIPFLVGKKIEWIEGMFPNFNIKIQDEEKLLTCSNIVIATGHEVYKPIDMTQFRYEESNVITLEELSRLILKNGETLINPKNGNPVKNILMVQCVGSRDEKRFKYCSVYCCNSAINHAIELKEKYNDLRISVSYFDIRSPYLDELTYQKARKLGVNFIRGKVAEIFSQNGILISKIFDTIANRFLLLENDLVVLSTAMIPNHENDEIFKFLKLNQTEDGFIKELYEKLRRLEVNRNGIYVCGTASGPKTISRCLYESHAVALKILQDHSSLNLSKDLTITQVNEEKCNGCGLCVEICPFNVPILKQVDENDFKAEIDEMSCRGCGICAGICPTSAAQLITLNKKQLFSQIDSLLEDAADEEIILGFTCHECAYSTIDSVGMLGWKYPENLRLLSVPCIGRVSLLDMLYSLDKGAKELILFSCAKDRCHYLKGNEKATLEVATLKELLTEIGWNKDIVEIFPLYSAEPNKFIEAIQMMKERLEKISRVDQ